MPVSFKGAPLFAGQLPVFHRIVHMAKRVRSVYEVKMGRQPLTEATSSAGAEQQPTWWGQVYSGYSDTDLQVFDRFSGPTFLPSPGFITDFLGVRTRAAFLAGVSAPSGVVMGLPIPTDNVHAETIEWVGVLKSVLASREQFVGMELGAGYGPWIVIAATAARRLGIENIHLTAVEADPGHFAFMQDHLSDNGIDPSSHNLIQAAVGTKPAQARWPRCSDPAADWGSRPVTDLHSTSDHLGRELSDWIDIEIRSFSTLLETQPVWDMVHIDVQGWEVDLCQAAEILLDQRVRWMIVGTHDPKLHGVLMEQMYRQGWELENEKPPRLEWRSGQKSLQAMITMDGTQVWRNPRLTAQARVNS